MALNANNIHVGPGDIFLGTTAPASGLPPTWLTHTNGVPGTGTHVGATQGEATFTWKPELTDIEAEQSLGVVDKFVSKEGGTLEFNAIERVYLVLQQAFQNIGKIDDGTRMGFYGGGGGSIITIPWTTIVVTSKQKNAPTKYEVLMAYKATSMEGMVLTWSRTKESVYKMTFSCIPDTTRSAGDQIFQYSREK